MSAAGGARRAAIPLLLGGLLGFIGGYFAGGGGRPPAPAAASAEGGGDRVEEARKAVEKDHQNPTLLAALGNACYDREDWDGAIQAYEKARRKASSDANLLSDLGAAYRNRGEFKKAIACFEKARSANPDHWQSLLNLVLVEAFDRRDPETSRRYFDELKRRFSDMPNLDRIEKQIKGLAGPASARS